MYYKYTENIAQSNKGTYRSNQRPLQHRLHHKFVDQQLHPVNRSACLVALCITARSACISTSDNIITCTRNMYLTMGERK